MSRVISTREIVEQMGGQERAVEQAIVQQERMAAAQPHSNFDELCVIEPRLRTLFERVPGIMRGRPDYGWQQWSSIKQQMERLVGMFAQKPAVASTEDYDIAYMELFTEAQKYSDEI